MQKRRTRTIQAIDINTGETVFYTLDQMPSTFQPSDLPHRDVALANELDSAEEGSPRLCTIEHKRRSKSGVNMEEVWKERGGDNISPKKTGGFKFKR